MNANEFSDALGNIDETYVDEAITYRRKHRWITWAAVAACLILIFNLWPRPGTEPPILTLTPTIGTQTYYADGVPLPIPDADSESLVTKDVKISLDVPSLPLDQAAGVGTAVMEISYQNPTNEPMTVAMTLPLGQGPRYLESYDRDARVSPYYPIRGLYRFTINGQTIEPTLRVTGTEAPPSADGSWSTKRINAGTVVTKYTYRITELEASDDPLIAIYGPSPYADIIALVETEAGYDILTAQYQTRYRTALDNVLELYVIGDEADYHAGWYFLDSWQSSQRISGTADLEDTQIMTFEEFAALSWKETCNASLSDWAFALAGEIDPSYTLGNYDAKLGDLPCSGYNWFQYELTLAPGETAVHSITLPLYPNLLSGYNFISCTYVVDLLSLKSLSATGAQRLTLETPLVMTDSTVHWAQNGTTYTLDLSRVNDLELSFALTNPEETETPADPVPTSPNWWVVGLCVVVLVVLFVLRWKMRRQVN